VSQPGPRVSDVAVLGLGNWGTALAHHLATAGHNVLGWTIEPEIERGIAATGRNPRFLSGVALSPRLTATQDLHRALERRLIVLAVPSAALGDVLPKLVAAPQTIFVSAVKGIETSSLQTPLQYARTIFPDRYSFAVLSGPSFARDVAAGRPCGVVAASTDEGVAREVAETFNSESMRVYLSTDPLGVEIGGITKNVIALAAGVSDGLGLGDSARAGLITRGLAEMMRLGVAMGARMETLAGLSGLGDLSMTATSDLSRNRTVGLRLGRGEQLTDIIASLGSVAEGVTTTPLVLELAKRYQVEMPITDHVARLLRGEETPQELVRSLIARPLRREF